MYITYKDYKTLGYDYISGGEFKRYCGEAYAAADCFTGSRLNADNLDEKAKRGLCAAADIIKKRRGEDQGSLAGFSNEGYSESYRPGSPGGLYKELYAIFSVWFGPDLLVRGVRT